MLVIGSRAAKHYIPSFRKPHDWDVICTPEEFSLFKKLNADLIPHIITKHSKKSILRMPKLQIEFEIAIPGSSGEELLSIISNSELHLDLLKENDFPVNFVGKIYYAVPEMLYLIKKSHIGYQIHWDKNILDYSFLAKHVPNLEFFSLVFSKFMEMRSDEMKARFSKRKKINLDKKNSDFFNATQKSVKRTYPHDMLHKYTCYYDRPLYERLKKDLSKAAVDLELWNKLSYGDKVKAVREEAYVIALERKIIPNWEKNIPYKRDEAFRWALMRISTNLTDGFFQQFALDNYTEIMKDIKPFDEMFFSKVRNAV